MRVRVYVNLALKMIKWSIRRAGEYSDEFCGIRVQFGCLKFYSRMSEVGIRKSEVGNRKPKSEVGSRKSESEFGSLESEVGSRKSGIGSRKSESEVGNRKSGVGSRISIFREHDLFIHFQRVMYL